MAASGLVENDGAFGARIANDLSSDDTLTARAPVRRLDRSTRGFLRALDPRPTGEARAAAGATKPNDDFFEDVDYVGAFAPDANWALSWTYIGQGGSEYPGLGLLTSPSAASSPQSERE
jgi:hypothetical protein